MSVAGYEDLLIEVSQFLCDHFSDSRIVHTGSKDALIQALASFICSPNTLLSLESVPYTRWACYMKLGVLHCNSAEILNECII